MMDRVRVLRILEYEGSREWVEETIRRSLTGEKQIGNFGIIRAATLGTYPEVLGVMDYHKSEDGEENSYVYPNPPM